MGRLIDADALISDLEYDIKMDQDSLDYEDLSDVNRKLVQNDKDCKQNAVDILKSTPTVDAVPVSTLEQIKWERDLFAEQIREIGGEPFAKWDAVDVVKVVRCKDCKFLINGKCFFTTKPKDLNNYCSLGEKVTKYGMKKFLVLSRCSPEFHRIVEAEDISEVADHYYDSCYGIIEISKDDVTE